MDSNSSQPPTTRKERTLLWKSEDEVLLEERSHHPWFPGKMAASLPKDYRSSCDSLWIVKISLTKILIPRVGLAFSGHSEHLHSKHSSSLSSLKDLRGIFPLCEIVCSFVQNNIRHKEGCRSHLGVKCLPRVCKVLGLVFSTRKKLSIYPSSVCLFVYLSSTYLLIHSMKSFRARHGGTYL